MLDWLNNDGQPSATEQSQIPDAPETPAPLFAYRALKGIIFGSPDYDDEHENKENIAPAQQPNEKARSVVGPKLRKTLPGDSSPLQSKSSRPLNHRVRDAAPTSPSPRKRPPVSPTKSILRTPGIPTPRRQKVNVTFKDVRASLSPVALAMKPPAALAARLEIPTLTTTTTAAAAVAKPSLTWTSATSETVELQALAAPVYDMSSVDAYLKSTEREMKKLVRYSQKMRDYARKSDQENVRLRREQEGLRREVEKLKRAKEARVVKGDAGLAKDTDCRRLSKTEVLAVELRAGPARVRRDVATTKTGEEEGGEDVDAQSTLTADLWGVVGIQSQESRNKHSNTVGKAVARVERQPDKAVVVECPLILERNEEHQQVTSQKKASRTAQLAPDRLAAAKERLRVKSEERRRALSSSTR